MTTNELFDLVAPIAIYGGADVEFKSKAKAAWRRIRKLDPKEWKRHGCKAPPINDLDVIYDWALSTYDILFETIVEEHGPPGLELTYDRAGAKGYMLPGSRSSACRMFGDDWHRFPWYETAELLIERLSWMKDDEY